MSMPIPTGPPPVAPSLSNVVAELKADIAGKSQKGTLVQYGPRWYPRPQTDNWWTTSATTATNTVYQIAHVVIPDPGYPYYIGVQASFDVSGVSAGAEYLHSAWCIVNNSALANPIAQDVTVVGGIDNAKTANGGWSTFTMNGHSQAPWVGTNTVYMMFNCGPSTVVLGPFSTNKVYRFDLETIPVPTM